jgi:hypothetical protein
MNHLTQTLQNSSTQENGIAPTIRESPTDLQHIQTGAFKSKSRSFLHPKLTTKQVLGPSPRKHSDPARLLHLPLSVMRQIYRTIRRPADQVKFALTCKTIARLAQTTPLNTTLLLLSPSKKKPSIRAYNTVDLRLELQCWESLRKCKCCKETLPKRRIWMTKEENGVEIRKLKNVDWLWAVKDWMMEGAMCPPCRIAEYYDGSVGGWLQCRSEGWASVTMFLNVAR